MANTLGNFNVPLFAARGLTFLMNFLGTPRRVNRAYEDERSSFRKGQKINIRRPGGFAVGDAPIATPDDVITDSVSLSLDNHKEVKMVLTDKELAYTSERFIAEHVSPMAYALADYIDAQLLDLSHLFPACQQLVADEAGIDGLAVADQIMREKKVPTTGRHYAASPLSWRYWIKDPAFSQWQGAGNDGVDTQRTAMLAQKYGFDPYPSNNVRKVAAQTTPTVTTGATNGDADKGATSIALDGVAVSGDFKKGMVIQIGTAASTEGSTYQNQLYAVTADVTAAGNAVTLGISPPLRTDVADGTTWSVKANAGAAAHVTDFAFHTDAIALCMVPLSMDTPGAETQTVTDANSGLSLRATRWYDANNRKNYFALDCLFALGVLDADMGVRGIVVPT